MTTVHSTLAFERELPAPIEAVFAAFADPAARAAWGVPSDTAVVIYDEADFREGGQDRFRCGARVNPNILGTVQYPRHHRQSPHRLQRNNHHGREPAVRFAHHHRGDRGRRGDQAQKHDPARILHRRHDQGSRGGQQRIARQPRPIFFTVIRRTDFDAKALIDMGRGDVPLIDMQYRCSNCGSSNTDWIISARTTGPGWDR